MDRAHIQKDDEGTWQLKKLYGSEQHRVELKDGKVILMATIGFIAPDDRIVPYSEVRVDNSTETDRTKTDIDMSLTVTATEVTRTYTKRDLTTEENDARFAKLKTETMLQLERKPAYRALAEAQFQILTGTAPTIRTKKQYITWLETIIDGFNSP